MCWTGLRLAWPCGCAWSRQFVMQWGDYEKSDIAPFSVFMMIMMMTMILSIPLLFCHATLCVSLLVFFWYSIILMLCEWYSGWYVFVLWSFSPAPSMHTWRLLYSALRIVVTLCSICRLTPVRWYLIMKLERRNLFEETFHGKKSCCVWIWELCWDELIDVLESSCCELCIHLCHFGTGGSVRLILPPALWDNFIHQSL